MGELKLRDVIRTLEILTATSCRVCGGEMTLGSSGIEGTSYSCEKAVKEWTNEGYPVSGEWWDHLKESRITIRDHKNADGMRYALNLIKRALGKGVEDEG